MHQNERHLRRRSQIALPAQWGAVLGLEARHQRANADGAAHQVSDRKRPQHTAVSEPVQSNADRTSALRAIRVAAKNARLDARLHVGGVVHRHGGENAVIGLRGGAL